MRCRFIWIGSGLGVWVWARDSVHVGISGIVHGLMFFVFLLGVCSAAIAWAWRSRCSSFSSMAAWC